jgi:hypothetical protein
MPNPATLESNSVENLIGMPYPGFKRFRKDPQVGGSHGLRGIRESRTCISRGADGQEPACPETRKSGAARAEEAAERGLCVPKASTNRGLIEKDPRSAHALVPKWAAVTDAVVRRSPPIANPPAPIALECCHDFAPLDAAPRTCRPPIANPPAPIALECSHNLAPLDAAPRTCRPTRAELRPKTWMAK